MILPLICYITQYLYFAPLHQIYPYFDFAYQYAGGLILPFYYINFRLLTVDEKFTFKLHAHYIVIPTVVATLYCIGAILTPRNEYLTWLFDEQAFPDSPYIRFLSAMRLIFRIQFLLQVILTFAGNRILLHKYGNRAEQYYSNSKDGKYNNSKMLNYSIIIICSASFVAVAIGRRLFISKDMIIYTVWSISTAMMCIIGYMGYKQKAINPIFDLQDIQDQLNQSGGVLNEAQNELLNKVLTTYSLLLTHYLLITTYSYYLLLLLNSYSLTLTPYLFLTSYSLLLISHSSFLTPHSSFIIPHSSFLFRNPYLNAG